MASDVSAQSLQITLQESLAMSENVIKITGT
jgi:hypothetical protein